MSEPIGVGTFAVLKWHAMMASAVGAVVMAVARPPKTRKALAGQAIVALGSSFLFGNSAAHWLDIYVPWVDLDRGIGDVEDFHIAVHGLVGAIAWGVLGGIGSLRDQLRNDPRNFIEWVTSLWKGK